MKGNLFGTARAKKAAIRYNHPSRSVRLILVAGEYGASTTALYLAELLRENNQPAAVFTPRGSYINRETYADRYDASADAVQRAISQSKKRCQVVVMVVTPAVVRSQVLDTLQVDTVVATSDGDIAHAILDLPTAYAVVPEGMSTEGLAIAPHQKISFGDSELAEAYIRNVVLYRKGTEVELTIDHQTNLTLSTYLLGRANSYNVAAAVATGYLLGLDITTFEEAIAHIEQVRGNLEEIPTEQVYRIYVDGASTERSAELVSASLKQLAKRRLLIACDESFSNDTLDILSQRADHVTVVKGEETNGRYHADNAKQAVELSLRSAKTDDTVLLLGPIFSAEADHTETVGEQLVREVLAA